MKTKINILISTWSDYELLDSGEGQKLERFGSYRFVRPEPQALWRKGLPIQKWDSADAVFISTGEESGGHWSFTRTIPNRWEMSYTLTPQLDSSQSRKKKIQFWAQTTAGRHVGVFPECAAHWDWIAQRINRRQGADNYKGGSIKTRQTPKMINVLNLFGYTGLATLAAAVSGASVTHLDASKKSVSWARENQALSGLEDKPVRWIVEDAIKYVKRESRRGIKYDGIILDPPKFGRGPKGEIWEVNKSLPNLLQACREILSDRPLFIILTVYAIKASPLHLSTLLEEMMQDFKGSVECGELVAQEKSAGRLLSQAVYARWSAMSER